MVKIVVNQEEFLFNYVDVISMLDRALKQFKKKYGRMPWGVNMGILEYASLIYYLEGKGITCTGKYPVEYCGVFCFCNPDYNGHVIPLLDFEDVILDNSKEI